MAGPPPPAGFPHRFRDRALRERALSHRSFSAANNERLEWLGDALIGAEVARTLFARRPRASEGELSALLSALVSRAALAQTARRLRVGGELRLGKSEEQDGGRDKESILAGALEALFAAAVLDGADSAELAGAIFAEALAAESPAKDAKSLLQERLQARRRPLPAYRLEAAHGFAHKPVFEISCLIDGVEVARARGPSKLEAERRAARLALARL